jgi:hypothetical protein
MRPRGPEREDHRDGRRERRRNQGQQHRRVDRGQQRARQPAARRGEGEQESDQSPADADEQRQQQAVPERADLVLVGQYRGDAGRREGPMIEQHAREQRGQRIQHEQREQRPQREHRDGNGRVAAQRGHDTRH